MVIPRFGLVGNLESDGAGTVAAIGAEVRDFRVGDKVYGYAFLSRKGGFYAENDALILAQTG
jgi:NADPH:quinone reductase